jgi:two-component system, sensor histidine kinase PdtaS
VATPLAVVITELLQNAAEHAFPGRHDDGEVTYDPRGGAARDGEDRSEARRPDPLLVDIDLDRTDEELRVTVRDNGVGLPDGFSVNGTSTLGLSIVRGLVMTQMGGAISMYNDGGTVVELAIPVDHASEDLERL